MNKPKRPQPLPASIQKFASRGAVPDARTPKAPSAYRPQPVPKCLQLKSATPPQKPQPGQAKATPTAPPAYRPQPPPRVLQRSTAVPGTTQSRSTPAPTAPRVNATRGVAVIQRTLKEARIYSLKQKQHLTMVTCKADVESQVRDPRVPKEIREELLAKYNNGLPAHEQIALGAAVAAAPPPAPEEVTEQNYFTFWSAGEFGPPQDNADGHFNKHVRMQREFGGRYRDVVEYTIGAREFAARPGLLSDGQAGGNWGMYAYDERADRGEMVVFNGQNSKLTSYYELSGGTEKVARYIESKLKTGSWQLVAAQLRQGARPVQPPAPLLPPGPAALQPPAPMPMLPVHAVSAPLPIPARAAAGDPRYAETPPHTPPGGWPDTPPGSPWGFH